MEIMCDKCKNNFEGKDWMIDAKAKGKQVVCTKCFSESEADKESNRILFLGMKEVIIATKGDKDLAKKMIDDMLELTVYVKRKL